MLKLHKLTIVNPLTSTRNFFRHMSKWGWIGLFSIVMVYVCISLINLTSLEWKGTADSYAHLDYTYQVSLGNLPDPYGYRLGVGEEENAVQVAKHYPHLTASHPPFFYYFTSLVAGGYLQEGRLKIATLLIRMINMFVGLVTILLLAYFGYQLGGRYSESFALFTPLAALAVPYIKFATDVYNDMFVALFGVIALGVSFLAVKHRPSWRLFVIFIFASALGMYSKATFAGVLLVGLVTIIVAVWLHAPIDKIRKAVYSIIIVLCTIGAVLMSSGWFYSYNSERSGSWFRARPKHQLQNRVYKSTTDNLLNPEFYNTVPGSLLGQRTLTGTHPYNRTISTLLVVTLIILASIWSFRNRKQTVDWFKSRSNQALFAASALVVLALYAQQLQHATGWGALNPRYFLAGMLVFGLLLAGLFVRIERRLRAIVALVFITLLAWGTIVNTSWYGASKASIPIEDVGETAVLLELATTNGFSSSVIYLALAGVVLGVVIFGISMYKIYFLKRSH